MRSMSPSLPLLSAKLSAPALPANLLERTRLNEYLQLLPTVRLVVLQAASGFGKTALVSQWARSFDGRLAWYALDELDNDPREFGRYLVNALHPHLADGCPQSLAQAEMDVGLNALLRRLLAELPQEHEPVLLVLDEFEALHNDEINQALRLLLRHLPTWLTLLVCSRVQPELGLSEWRIKQQLLELDAGQLAFDIEEIRNLLERALPVEINLEQTERFHRRTLGWPCAAQLLVQEVRTVRGMDTFLESLKSGHPYIRDYFREQVLAGLPGELIDFLYTTCLLRRFNASLADRLARGANGREMLECIERRCLFIREVEGQRQWYTYHPLFSKFLQSELHIHRPQLIQPLHQSAAQALIEEGLAEEAARHALLANDSALLEQILQNHGRDFYRQGRLTLLHGCLEALSPNNLQSPLLALLRAWVLQNQFRFAEAEQQLEASAEELRRSHRDEEWRRIEAEFKVVRAENAIAQGDHQAAMRLAEEALTSEPLVMRTSRVVATSVMAESHFVQGNLLQAQSLYEETERRAREINASHALLWCLGQLSEISIAQGHLQKAYNLQERALHYIEQEKVLTMPVMEFLARVRGQVLCEWHHLDAAEQAALHGIAILDSVGEHWFLQCYTLLARVALARGQEAVCTDYIERLQGMLAAGDYHLDWQANAHSVMLSYWDSTQDKDAIQQWLLDAPAIGSCVNHFNQCNARNHARAYLMLGQCDKALQILQSLNDVAERHRLVMDVNRNEIFLALLHWQREERRLAMEHLYKALVLASDTSAIGSFLYLGKTLIVMLKALQQERELGELENQRANRLIQLAQQQREFKRIIRINLDEAVIQDIINRPDVPELIRHSPLTRREWQVLNLIHAGLINEQIAERLNVASSTLKTHIRSLYQKLNISNRTEAVQIARHLLRKIQGE